MADPHAARAKIPLISLPRHLCRVRQRACFWTTRFAVWPDNRRPIFCSGPAATWAPLVRNHNNNCKSCRGKRVSLYTMTGSERKAALGKLLRKAKPGIRYSEHLSGDGRIVFDQACRLGL